MPIRNADPSPGLIYSVSVARKRKPCCRWREPAGPDCEVGDACDGWIEPGERQVRCFAVPGAPDGLGPPVCRSIYRHAGFYEA